MAKKLKEDKDGDYILIAESVWLTAGNVNIYIARTRSRVIVKLYHCGKELESPITKVIASQIMERE